MPVIVGKNRDDTVDWGFRVSTFFDNTLLLSQNFKISESGGKSSEESFIIIFLLL